MRIPAVLIAVTFLGSAFLVRAQVRKESSGPAVYAVEFDIREGSDGEAQPGRHFSMLVGESWKGMFQAASRVPIATGSPQYVDVGVNIECTVHESDGKAVLHGAIELTSITGYVNVSAIAQPIIRQRKMAFDTTLALGMLTVIVDDPNALAAQGSSIAAAETRQVKAMITKVN